MRDQPTNRIAGDPDAYRPRSARGRGRRALRHEIQSRAAPRSRSTGDEGANTAGGGGSGGGSEFGSPFITTLPEENITGGGGAIDSGDPVSGKRYAIWGHFCWDSTNDLWGP